MIRRLAFVVGAALLIGGWAVTKYIDAHQMAAGPKAGLLWREGVRRAAVSMQPSSPAPVIQMEDSTILDLTLDEALDPEVAPSVEQVFQILDESRGSRSAPARETKPVRVMRQVVPPLQSLYLGSLLVMAAGGVLMALTVPLGRRGRRQAFTSEPVEPMPRLRLRGP